MLDIDGLSYGWPEEYPDEGFCWSNQPNTAVFKKIMDHLFSISDDEYIAQLSATGFDEIMTYDPGNNLLKSILDKELGATSTPMR